MAVLNLAPSRPERPFRTAERAAEFFSRAEKEFVFLMVYHSICYHILFFTNELAAAKSTQLPIQLRSQLFSSLPVAQLAAQRAAQRAAQPAAQPEALGAAASSSAPRGSTRRASRSDAWITNYRKFDALLIF